ncbi:unnamed protein product [Acanthoscelides obtectus]|uniref:Uncharacterized protein n=1 Tax=Acanthoscelides obtectus TaxID=200917 RepID=A0A9P0NZY5_ACAOB|nr:unnamed protein product [Acanthoscelides obtectus]CAK1633943.1 hypothetical protein AOBTE_LOCUS8497 [Acanthoscelides obtectus]
MANRWKPCHMLGEISGESKKLNGYSSIVGTYWALNIRLPQEKIQILYYP